MEDITAEKNNRSGEVDVPAGSGSNNLSLPEHQEMEAFAAEVANTFADCCVKLVELKPKVNKIRDWFRNNRGAAMLAGCSSFKSFCEVRLHRTEQAAYAMLGEYAQKSKTKAKARTRKSKQRKTKPQSSTPHQVSMPDEDIERMRTGCNAAARHFQALAKWANNEANAKQEFLAITKAESLKSVIASDQPNYKAILVDLLAEIEKVGEKVPVPLTRKCQAIRERLGVKDAAFGLTDADRQQANSDQVGKPETISAVSGKVDHTSGQLTKSKTSKDSGPTIVNGLEIKQRKDSRFVVFDPTKMLAKYNCDLQ